ncbi:ATPase [Aureococcus anophagefferens]|nr:ATPase [Aureococcus anophagefferens]
MIPVIMMSMAFVFKLIMGDGGESGGAHSGASAVASEAVLHVRTVRAARAEADVLARFAKITDAVAAEKVGAAWKGGVAYGLGMAIIFTLYLVVFAFGPVCVDEGWCSPTDMWKALFCIMFGAFGAGSSAIFAQDANKAKIAAELAGLDLVFDAVSFAYPARREALVLDGLCLRVPASSTCAFVGPSGSGKSTIIQLVQRFYEPSAGAVTLGGAALASYDVAYLRSILGFVGQEPVLFDASLADNVRYGAPDATDGALAEKQRVAIARALVRDPKLLLLDEATSALDSRSEKLVQEALEQARAGRTTLVVAHRLSTIEDSDQIVVMVGGTCAESGTHASLLEKRGVYHTLQNRARA